MQVPLTSDPARTVDHLISDALSDQRGLGAWKALLRAHASLMRALATDLATATGMTLGEFDVLMQLAVAGGELRMTDLAARVFSSRSGMTRRIDRLVEAGLVRRARVDADTDARGVAVALTDDGLARLSEVLPVHVRKVAELFVEPLETQELVVLERALGRVTQDCSFG
jgi:DNA-binding MarR family transcriptional regulator